MQLLWALIDILESNWTNVHRVICKNIVARRAHPFDFRIKTKVIARNAIWVYDPALNDFIFQGSFS
jgi:hypothetical protein